MSTYRCVPAYSLSYLTIRTNSYTLFHEPFWTLGMSYTIIYFSLNWCIFFEVHHFVGDQSLHYCTVKSRSAVKRVMKRFCTSYCTVHNRVVPSLSFSSNGLSFHCLLTLRTVLKTNGPTGLDQYPESVTDWALLGCNTSSVTGPFICCFDISNCSAVP